jgi:hypothetical protein
MKMNPMGLDPLLNLLSGRTAMLKKELEVEKKERLLVIIDAIFKEGYFINTLKISPDYVNGFKHYCVEDANFATVLASKNKTKIDFLMGEMAEKYNKIITSEK